MDIPPGLLALKPKPTLAAYSARIVVDGPQEIFLAPGEFSEICVEVENDSPCCWPVCDGSSARFGVSYHLLSDTGQLIVWDMPRAFLPVGRKGYVAFVEPAQKLTCKLKVFAPSEPGRYVVQFDLVQELVEWFSHQGVKFPCIDMEVREQRPNGGYVVSGPGIVHETIDQETVIIDTMSGTYFGTSGYGSLIWNAIADGHRLDQIISAFASAAIFTADQGIVERFVSQLLAEKLIAASNACGTKPRGKLRLERLSESLLPALTKRSNLKELIAMHPVRGASAQAGWPRAGTVRRPD